MKTLGVMLDCSRNGVMKPDKVKEFAKIISDMGYNMLQLYTEDTYEIEDEPFFGHMRGRYSLTELREMDEYCHSIGVELIPCIQTLAHLNQLVQWEPYSKLFDCNDILMVGEEKVYVLIDKMFDTLKKCFRTRRVHVGMDEAHFIGRGKYQDKHGYRNRIDIITEHLSKVTQIAKRHGFTIMMWSDMFIRINNNGEYVGKNIKIPLETIESVPEGVELVYWDYYSKDKSHYDEMLKTHAMFNNPIGFAGGMWTWTGYAPNLSFTWDATKVAIQSIRENPVDTVFFTMWGDNGKDCSFYTMLPMLFAAKKMLDGNFDKEDIAKQFEEKYQYSFEEFMNLELANMKKGDISHFYNPNKYLLFNDPFLGLYDFTVSEDLANHYQESGKLIEKSINGREYDYIFEVQKRLLDVLAIKCDLGLRLRAAYQNEEKETLREIVAEFTVIREKLKLFFDAFRYLWLRENKPFGLEVQEQRFGGLLYRMDCCGERLQAYLDGKISCIEELNEQQLTKVKDSKGKAIEHNNWSTTVTASVN